jgi:hypothetical protein
MTDTPPKPKRRRWRRLVAGVGLLLVICMAAWNLQANRALAERASRVVVGQSMVDVIAILGQPDLTGHRGKAGHFCYGSGVRPLWMITALSYKYLGVGKPLPIVNFPVEVTFGKDGRVVSVRHPLDK